MSIVSIVAPSYAFVLTPKKSLSCPTSIVTAIPAVNPVVIVYGINLIKLPNLQNPIIISRIPAIIVATTSPSIPFLATIPATIVAKAAVGPAICTLLPPKSEITKPATIAVYIPACGSTPDAIANAIDNGNAIIATIIPAIKSLINCAFVYVFIFENNIGFNLSIFVPLFLDIYWANVPIK